jgi:hypothetical protein
MRPTRKRVLQSSAIRLLNKTGRGGTKMRNVLIAAALVALTGSAQAAPKHTWFNVNFGSGQCELSKLSPADTLALLAGPVGRGMGYETDRIAPDDVVKTPDGQLHVTVRATINGVPHNAEFFTSKPLCDAFVKGTGLTPQSAPENDIN